MPDYEEAAQNMGMGVEWLMDMMTKLEEQGLTHTYVSSLTEAALKTQDLDEQMQLAVDTYDRMVKSGTATDEELQEQAQHVQELANQYSEVQNV